MARPYPSHPRRRPGRRPPDRHPARPAASYDAGFTPPGVALLYHLGLPTLAGGEKRAFFNTLARWLVAICAGAGAILGYTCLGTLGVIPGLGGGLVAGTRVAVTGRFYRR